MKVILITLLALSVTARKMSMDVAPLNQKVMSLDFPNAALPVPNTEFSSPTPPSTHISQTLIMTSMRLPDPSAHMASDKLVPQLLRGGKDVEAVEESGSDAWVNRRNMVLGASDAIEMSPDLEQGDGCADEASVLDIGVPPTVSPSLVFPVKELHGTAPEFNSFKDFASGGLVTDGVGGDLSFGGVSTSDVESQEFQSAALNDVALEPATEMAFKLVGKFQVSGTSLSLSDFDSMYSTMIRESIALGALVPIANVMVMPLDKTTRIFSFEVGAPSLNDVENEMNKLRQYVVGGGMKSSLTLKGFPVNIILTIVDIGGGVDPDVMPEPTVSDQVGPPGGVDLDSLSPSQQRARLVAREQMTYSDYTMPPKPVNTTKKTKKPVTAAANASSPSAVAATTAPPNTTHHVVGRISFVMQDASHFDSAFDALYLPVIARALAAGASVPVSDVVVRRPRGAELIAAQSLLQADVAKRSVIVDFEIISPSYGDAKEAVSLLLENMASQQGFKSFLIATYQFPSDFTFTLMFVEVHSPTGEIVGQSADEGETSCDEDEDDDLPSEALSASDMDSPENCTSINNTATPSVVVDPSVMASAPVFQASDDWAVMSMTTPSSYMNTPTTVRSSTPVIPPTTVDNDAPGSISAWTNLFQAALPTLSSQSPPADTPPSTPRPSAHHRSRVDQLLQPTLLLQEPEQQQPALRVATSSATPVDQELPRAHVTSMREAFAEQMLVASGELDASEQGLVLSDDDMKAMPEDGGAVGEPEGGFPVQDLDPGV